MFFDRTESSAKQTGARRPIRTHMFPAPRLGLLQNDNIANPNPEGAAVLDNYYPTAKTVRLRKGSNLHATVDDAATETIYHMPVYQTGGANKLFACTETEVFDVTSPADAETEESAVVSNQTNGDWVSTQFATTGNSYLVMVNGEDSMLHYDGSYWASVGLNAAVSTLDYDAETGAFAEGETLTGGTSGATATIQRVIDNGTIGTLLLTGISGTFQDNETITDGATGSADADGTVTEIVPAFTGVNPALLSSVWEHKSRLWFLEDGTLSAWYLPTDSRVGAATEFPLQGVFYQFRQLWVETRWPVDSGSGLDDLQVFITDQGEVAVYQGTDPSSADTWSIVGVYEIGRPMGKKAYFSAGGDLAVITDDGIIPISQALQKDRAALSALAITYPIEDLWRRYVKQDSSSVPAFEGVLWGLEAMFLVTMPQISGEDNFCLIANSRTGAWARYTGWDARCFALLGDRCFFGTSDGRVIEAEVGGSDLGVPYTARLVYKFSPLKTAGVKNVNRCKASFITNTQFTPGLFALADFSEDYPSAGANTLVENDAVWGTAVWGETVWQAGDETYMSETQWETTYANGAYIAPGVHIVSGITAAPYIELTYVMLQYEEGNIL